MLRTDGIGCSLLFKRVEDSNSNRHTNTETTTTESHDSDSYTHVHKLSNDDIERLKKSDHKFIVGCDPGKYSMVCEYF